VRDPGGTIWIAELASYKSIQGNNFASDCAGPDWAGGAGNHDGSDANCFQVDSTQKNLDTGSLGRGYGGDIYASHGNQFNYLFHDGHVASLKYTDTIGIKNANNGTATAANPGGM
jgi:prepilin-type processing-associated H-X9-DG protein